MCEICGKDFTNELALKSHRKITKHYNNILITCLHCQFKTTKITHFENHKCFNNDYPIQDYESLKARLDIEIAKNEVYSRIHYKTENTTEKIEHLPKKIPEIEQDEKKYPGTYRPVKNIKIVQEITDDEKNNRIAIEEGKRMKTLNMFSDIKDALPVFEKDLKYLSANRVYKKTLIHMMKVRFSLIGSMNLVEYIDLINTHLSSFKNIFTSKEYTDKKIQEIISHGLAPIEQRLIMYSGFTSTHLDIDDLEKFGISLTLNTYHPDEYIPFELTKFTELFLNYGSVVFPITTNIKRYIINIYGMNNVIYLPLPKSTEQDPFSFYVLENVHKSNRKWKMDCRLEEITNNLISVLKPYMIGMFRKIYYTIFNDNDYRKDYISQEQITECDCEQLIQNILCLSTMSDISMKIRNIVMENCAHYPTENDRFNLYGDDSLQRQRLESKKCDQDPIDVVRLLFDNITSENAVDFYRNRQNNI